MYDLVMAVATKKEELTPLQRKFIDYKKRGETTRDAMRLAGYSNSSVTQAERVIKVSPAVQAELSTIQQEINKHLGPEKYAQKLVKLTEAKRYQMGLNEFVDDNNAQLKALEIAGKIQDYIKPPTTTINTQVNVQNVLD